MADGRGTGRLTVSGVVLAGLLWILIVVSLWLFLVQEQWWFPTLASNHGASLDGIFSVVLIVTGIAFVVVQGIFGYFVARYGQRGNERASNWHDNLKVETLLVIVTAVILTVLVFMGQRVWAAIYYVEAPQDALLIEVTGEQFVWTFHYPGADGQFGRKDPALISQANQVGLDREDPVAKDDIVTLNQMHIPVNQPVRVRLRSKDVIHSFFLPNFRVKQDTVPGMAIEIWFVPNKAGEFEIACAELCGLGHYRMRAFLTVDESREQFDRWLREQAEAAAGN